MKPVGVALVGYGYAGKTFHAPLIAAAEGLRLDAVVSSQGEAVKADWPDAKAVADLDAALADPEVGLVVIAAPNALHAPMARQALEAGRAVVVDKPFTLTVAEARGLADLAQARGLLLSVFHNRRWDADFLTLQALIAAGRLGRILRFESHFDRFRPQVRDRWREADTPGAGIWYDLGPHLIDQALVLFGRPLAITADLAILRQGGQATDYAHAVLRYEDFRAILHADMTSPAPDLRFSVQGDRAAWIKSGLDVQEDQLKAHGRAGGDGWGLDPRPGTLVDGLTGARTPTDDASGDYRRYYDQIALALRGRAPNPVPPAQAIAVMEVLEAGLLSAQRRGEQPL
ncbi:MAG: oxidoreductase [Brevundimonas sp.]|uniref:Oxidoreductase n=1 Tax=Brevundimonas albigilva TaxID=1312364 RepID=A0ABY4SNQ0_9CAUL|nr:MULTISPECIES: oxidoreductase [Brevundimonas]PZU54797.1 MAG: oxidoreductase [Brevundimonas sp.]URI15471.1 oxidoreductase [Brevundimonas albigilva]